MQISKKQQNGAELPPAPLGPCFAGGAASARQHHPGSISPAGAPGLPPLPGPGPSAPAERWRPNEGASAARPHCPDTHRLRLCCKLIYSLIYSMCLYNSGRGWRWSPRNALRVFPRFRQEIKTMQKKRINQIHHPSPPELRNKALPQSKVKFNFFFSLSVGVWRKQIAQQNKASSGFLGAASRRDENRS